MDKDAVTICIKMIDKKYGKDIGREPPPLTFKRGNKHEYLGMLLYYSAKGKVKINMTEYLSTIFEDLPKDLDESAVTPAASY